MRGTDATTGRALSGLDHLRQSIRDILTTPLGSRVMRRDYGSELFALVDSPMNARGLLAIYAATAGAIARWEPRFEVERVTALSAEPGRVELEITGKYLPDGQTVAISGVIV